MNASCVVKLRPAAEGDCRHIWEWRNESTAREASFNSEPISYEEHTIWFTRQLADPNSRVSVVLSADGEEVGYVRLDIRGEDAYISVSIDKRHRGRGYGVSAIKKASTQILNTAPVSRIVALVRQDNPPAQSLFVRAGFVQRGSTTVNGVQSWRLEYPIGNA